MLLQKEKQSIEEIGKKDKKIYERRKVSLSNICHCGAHGHGGGDRDRLFAPS